MKNYNLLIWLTQLGMSVAIPPLGFILLASWLHKRCHWGKWVIWVAILLGIVCAVDGLRTSLKAMSQMSADKEKKESRVFFNDHD